MPGLRRGPAQARSNLGAGYHRLWAAVAVSTAGDGVVLAALPLLAASLGRDPLAVSLVTFASWLPWLLFGLISGALVDRWDRRRVMWRVDGCRFALVAVLGVAVLAGWTTIPLLAAIGFLLGSVQTLFDNAAQSLIPALVTRDTHRLERANSQLYGARTVGQHLVRPGVWRRSSRGGPRWGGWADVRCAGAVPGWRRCPGGDRAAGAARRERQHGPGSPLRGGTSSAWHRRLIAPSRARIIVVRSHLGEDPRDLVAGSRLGDLLGLATVTWAGHGQGGLPMVTDQQLDHYRTYGFVVLAGYLEERETAALRQELDAALRDGFGARFHQRPSLGGIEGHHLPMMSRQRTPISLALVEDARFLGAARRLLDAPVLPTYAEGILLFDQAGFHYDDGTGSKGVKLVAYLEPLTAQTGALRLMPGSQHPDFAASLTGWERRNPAVDAEGLRRQIGGIPCHVAETRPGDVIAFDWHTWHASINGTDRLQWTISYARDPCTTEETRRFQDLFQSAVPIGDEPYDHAAYPCYDDHWLSPDPAHPERARLSRRMRELGLFQIASGR